MSANIDIYSYASLTNAVNLLKPGRSFILDKFFTNRQNHATRTIYYGKQSATDKLAVFVNPHENPRLVAQMEKGAWMFELPITREKKFWNAEDLAREKVVGEIFIGDASMITTQANEKILYEIQDLKNRVIRLREWMAAQAMSTGTITVTQANISFTINYNFGLGTNLVTNTGTDLWDNTSSKPLAQIDTWKSAMAARGYKMTDCLLGSEAAKDFKAHASIIADNLRAGYLIGTINRTNPFTDYGNYIGNINGIDFWEYSYQYTNSSNVSTPMISAERAVFVGTPTDMTPASNPFRLHTGPIYRIAGTNGVQTIRNEMFLESEVNAAKTNLEFRLEQCSLPAIHDANAIISVIATTAP